VRRIANFRSPSRVNETQAIEHGARLLADGGVVAIPTETVYGLAADARNAQAVARIFAIKQRPTTHPLIVHLGDPDWLDAWAVDIPDSARVLARTFWPGPLTMVLNRHPDVLAAVTGGQDSVALRMPAHPLALRLIRAFGRPLVAPSANRFTHLSPTCAEDVRVELGDAVDFILDGGPCRVGVESTIVDVRDGGARILRPGGVAAERIEAALGRSLSPAAGGVRVPGQHPLHYSPDARVTLLASEDLVADATRLAGTGLRVGVLLPPGITDHDLSGVEGILPIAVPAAPEDYAASLYHFLRVFDQQGCDVILASLPDATGLGAAIRDRLQRAAGPKA
jgi:L-threonylcarbamoyladenylate synthase